MNDTLVKRKITYTYTLPNGAVVVVRNVPALCDEDSEDDFCGFSEPVMERLSKLINTATARNPTPGDLVQLDFSEDPRNLMPEVDLELRARGPGLVLGHVPVNLLQKLLDNIADAYRIAANVLAQKQGAPPPPPPQVAFLTSGSLVIGLRSSEAAPLFPEERSLGRRALDLILQGAEWVRRGVPEEEDPDIAVAAIEAVKQLTPGPREGFKVELVEYYNRKKVRSTELAPALKERASAIIEEIVAKRRHKRVTSFIGQLDQIKLDGQAHLRKLRQKPKDYNKQTLTFSYPEKLLDELLEVFGKTVRIAVEEEQTPEGRHFTALDVELAEV